MEYKRGNFGFTEFTVMYIVVKITCVALLCWKIYDYYLLFTWCSWNLAMWYNYKNNQQDAIFRL